MEVEKTGLDVEEASPFTFSIVFSTVHFLAGAVAGSSFLLKTPLASHFEYAFSISSRLFHWLFANCMNLSTISASIPFEERTLFETDAFSSRLKERKGVDDCVGGIIPPPAGSDEEGDVSPFELPNALHSGLSELL